MVDVRKHKTGLGIALTCAIAIGALSPAAAQDMPFESKITIGDGPPAFHGKVKSDNVECVGNRKVRVFRVRNGEDKLLGKDRTDVSGNWEVLVSLKGGAYYAKVNRYERESPQLFCLPDRTKRVLAD